MVLVFRKWSDFNAACLRIMEGHEAVVKFLISRGVHLNDTDNTGGTPLHRTVIKGHLDIVVDLIEAGAAIDRKLWSGYTALILCRRRVR
jgi:ankyrin repeat protein